MINDHRCKADGYGGECYWILQVKYVMGRIEPLDKLILKNEVARFRNSKIPTVCTLTV